MIDLRLGSLSLGGAFADQGASEYGPVLGLEELRAAIAEWCQVDKECVGITTGATLGLVAALCAARSTPGSCVLCPRPYYPGYPAILRLLGLRPRYYGVPAGLPSESLVRQILSAAGDDTAAILWNFPHNPTGATDTPQSFRALRAACRARGIALISDRVYCDLVDNHSAAWSWVDDELLPGEVRVGSFSKAFALAGERIGFVLGQPDSVERMMNAHWTMAMSAPVSGQRSALRVLTSRPHERVEAIRAHLRENVEAIRGLDSIPGLLVRRGAASMFAWIELPQASLNSAAIETLLARSGLAVTSGDAFGSELPSFRLNLGADADAVRRGAHVATTVLTALSQRGLI